MKNQNIIILVIISGIIGCCNYKKEEMKKNAGKLKMEKTYEDSLKTIYCVLVTANDWQHKTTYERYVDVTLPSITEEIINNGEVLIYLKEKERYLELPFNYYQVKRILSFEPSYKQGHAYINVFGNFIINVSVPYEFKIIVASKKSNSNL